MKTKIKTVAAIGVVVIAVCTYLGCTKDASKSTGSNTTSGTPITLKTPVSRASLGQSAFTLWGTCSDVPYDISGSNGIAIPVGGTEFSSNDLAAQQPNGNGQDATGLQFYGCFKGGSSAPSSSNEMAVFVTDDVTNWVGHEMGFVETLNDHTLKAYLQGNGNYITEVLTSNDNGYHTFKCQCESGDHSKVDFYLDGTYKFTMQNSGSSYWDNYDYFVGTTHRTSSSWSSTGQQIEMYNMTTY